MQSFGRTALTLIVLLILGLTTSHPAGAVSYNIYDLGTLGGDYSGAYDINDHSQIVGKNSAGAFLWENDTMTKLDFEKAYDINNQAQIVGGSADGYGVLWENGTVTTLFGPAGQRTQAYGLNNQGRIVGYTAGFAHEYASWWDNGEVEVIGGGNSSAKSINNQAQIAGYSRFGDPDGDAKATVWENGTPIDLGTLSPGGYSYAYGINDFGQVVGYSWILNDIGGADNHAFLWENGEMTDLGTLGGTQSFAYGINNKGQIVGWSNTSSGEQHAVLWEKASAPIPEPTTMLLIGTGLIGLVGFRRRFRK